MRRSKIIEVEGRGEVTVKEVSPLVVYEAWQAEDRVTAMKRLADECIQPGFDDIRGWYASEIQQVVDAFFEANSAFFALARTLKVDGLLEKMVETVADSLPVAFADSFRAVMSMPGITDGSSS